MPRPGPSLNSALWGFEVDSCCGSSEGPAKRIICWGGQSLLALFRLGSSSPSPSCPQQRSGPGPATPAPAACQGPVCGAALGAQTPGSPGQRGGPGSRIFPPWEFSTQVAVAAVLWPSSDGMQYYRAATHSRSHFGPVSAQPWCQESWER